MLVTLTLLLGRRTNMSRNPNIKSIGVTLVVIDWTISEILKDVEGSERLASSSKILMRTAKRQIRPIELNSKNGRLYQSGEKDRIKSKMDNEPIPACIHIVRRYLGKDSWSRGRTLSSRRTAKQTVTIGYGTDRLVS